MSTFTESFLPISFPPSSILHHSIPSSDPVDQIKSLPKLNPECSLDSATLFLDEPPNCLIRARLIDNGYQIELHYLSFLKSDSLDNLPPVRLSFNEKILPAQGFTLIQDSIDNSILYVLALTETAKIYRLTFRAPDFFYLHSPTASIADHVQEYPVAAVQGKTAVLLHVLDPDTLLISCDDGSLVKCTQDRRSREMEDDDDFMVVHDDAWTERVLVPKASWSFFSTRAIGGSADAYNASTTLSAASIVGRADILDVAFTFSKDRKLRIWSLDKERLVNTFELAQLVPAFASQALITKDTADSMQPRANLLLPDLPTPILRVVVGGTDLPYSAYLVVYCPRSAALSQASSAGFLVFGLRINDAGDVDALEPITQRWLPPSYASGSAELRDWQVSRVALRGDRSSSAVPFALYTLWHVGDQSLCLFVTLDEMTGSQYASTDWTPVLPSITASERSWTRESFGDAVDAAAAQDTEEDLPDASSRAEHISHVFLTHLLLPNRYSFSALRSAIGEYIGTLPESDALPESLPYGHEELHASIAALVGITLQVAINQVTGAPLLAEYNEELFAEYIRFVAMADEAKAVENYPLNLVVDETGQCVLIERRNGLSMPILQDESILLMRQAANTENETFLDLPTETLEQSYRHLALQQSRATLLQVVALSMSTVAAVEESTLTLVNDALLAICAQSTNTMTQDALDLVYDQHLQPFVQDKFESILIAFEDLSDPYEAISLILSICSELSTSTDSAEEPELSTIAKFTTAWTIADIFQTRHRLILGLLVLLICLGEDDTHATNLSPIFTTALPLFRSLYVLKWLGQQPGEPSKALAPADDSLAGIEDGFNRLFTSSSPAVSAPSLVDGLLQAIKVSTTISSSITALPTEAAGTFISGIRLLHLDKPADIVSNAAGLATSILRLGHPKQTLLVLNNFEDTAATAFVKARANLELDHSQEAADQFEQAAAAIGGPPFPFLVVAFLTSADSEAGLDYLLPSEVIETLVTYFWHVSSLYHEMDPSTAAAHILRFTVLALDADADADADAGASEQVLHDLHQWRFEAGLYVDPIIHAFPALLANPFTDLRLDCLRQLITVVCEAGDATALIDLQFGDSRSEFEDHLEFRARHSDTNANPSFVNILYAYYVSRKEYGRAASTMYTHAQRLSTIPMRHGNFQAIATQRCQSYLACINAFSLLDPDQAWISVSTSANTRDSGEKRVVDLKAVRMEYALALARLELVGSFAELSSSTELLAADFALALYSRAGRFDKAVAIARTFSLDTASTFANLTDRCLQPGGHDVTAADYDKVDSSSQSKAWQQLESIVTRHGKPSDYSQILSTLLEDETADLPAWLTTYYVTNDPDHLTRQLFNYGYATEALQTLTAIAESHKVDSMKAVVLPWQAIDFALAIQPEDGREQALQEKLKIATEVHLKRIAKAQRPVR